MAQPSLLVLLSLACFSGVQGSVAELSASDALRAGLKDSSLSMPKLAGLLQQHIGKDSTGHSPWRAQAEMFLGLLQGMGGQVPEDKANQTQYYVDQIIELLTNSTDSIYADATTTKETTQAQLNDEFSNLESQERLANQALEATRAADTELADCYAHLREIAEDHAEHCGEHDLPEECVIKNNTKMHSFDVATKATWACNFTAGSTPTACTNDASPLKTDLVSHRDLLRIAYQQWVLHNRTCQTKLDWLHGNCTETNNTYWEKKDTCKNKFNDASWKLCTFRAKIDQWTRYLTTLQATQTRAVTLLPPKKREWTDINLIICMLRKFKNRRTTGGMTFKEPDYGQCEAEAGGLQWVGDIDTLVTELTTLTTNSQFSTECLDFSFTGGLAQKHMSHTGDGAPVVFFTQPEIAFSFNTDGSSGCTQTTVTKTKVCQAGEPFPAA